MCVFFDPTDRSLATRFLASGGLRLPLTPLFRCALEGIQEDSVKGLKEWILSDDPPYAGTSSRAAVSGVLPPAPAKSASRAASFAARSSSSACSGKASPRRAS